MFHFHHFHHFQGQSGERKYHLRQQNWHHHHHRRRPSKETEEKRGLLGQCLRCRQRYLATEKQEGYFLRHQYHQGQDWSVGQSHLHQNHRCTLHNQGK